MMQNWLHILHPDRSWKMVYPGVAVIVKEFFLTAAKETYTTDELVEELYPEAVARGEGITARKRLYKALAALAVHDLAAYATRGPERPLKHNPHKMVRPWLWHAPDASIEKLCPHCGGKL